MLQQGPATPGQHRGAFAQHASRDPGSSSVHMYCAMGARSRRAGAAEASTSQHVRSARPGWCARGARPVHKFVHAFLRLGRERGRHLRGSRAQAGRQNEHRILAHTAREGRRDTKHRILAHTAREGRWDTYRCARPRKVCWGASSLTPLHAGHVDSCVKKFKVDFFFPTMRGRGGGAGVSSTLKLRQLAQLWSLTLHSACVAFTLFAAAAPKEGRVAVQAGRHELWCVDGCGAHALRGEC